MSAAVPQLLLVSVLIILNALFSGTEIALVSLREGQLQRLEQTSSNGATLARLARRPNQFLATIQIGITLAGFLASAAAAVAIAEPLVSRLHMFGSAAEPVAILLVTLILSYLTLVFGELAPKRIALQRAEKWGLLMARPLSAMTRVTRPVVWLLSKSTDTAVRLFGADPAVQREEVTEDEIRDLVAVQATFTQEQRRIIDGAFEIADRVLSEVMIPRGDIFVLKAHLTANEAITALSASGHSRAPVAETGNLDDVVGFVHLRQLIGKGEEPVTGLLKEPLVFPSALSVLNALRELQGQRTQIALVANEYGGIDGLVTLEDLIEELVGEIYDETDRDLAAVVHLDDGSMLLPGRFPIHDLVDLGIDLPEGEYVTIAGLVLDELGFIPDSAGSTVTINGREITVTKVRRRTIGEVRISAAVD